MTKQIVLIAHNHEHARFWCRQNEINPVDVIIVTTEQDFEKLAGLRAEDVDVVEYTSGNFHGHRDEFFALLGNPEVRYVT